MQELILPRKTESYSRLGQLDASIKAMAPVVVAYSGGLDSSFLLWACSRALEVEQIQAITFCSPTTPLREIQDAQRITAWLNIKHNIYPGPEMHSEEFLVNDLLRCYYCKRERLAFLLSLATEYEKARFIEGSVLDDLDEYRPGMKALEEAGITSPLLEAGISKEDIGIIAQDYKLPFAGKKTESCLATRIKTGHRIELPLLERIQGAEDALHAMGFELVRIRWNAGETRLELAPGDLEKAFSLRQIIIERVKKFGFSSLSLDLEGYKIAGKEQT